MFYSIKTNISTSGQHCDDFCLAMFSDDGYIYCGLFTNSKGSHKLILKGENVLRHSKCVQDCQRKTNVIILKVGLLYDFMRDNDLSRSELAKLVDIPEGTLNNYLRQDRQPGIKNLEKIAKVLKCDTNDLRL